MRPAVRAFPFVWLAVMTGILAADIPADKVNIVFEGKRGTVTFAHEEHADRLGEKCSACHHKWEAEEIPRACSACHDRTVVKDEAPKLKVAVHKNCWNCHQERLDAGEATGPVKKECKLCHKK